MFDFFWGRPQAVPILILLDSNLIPLSFILTSVCYSRFVPSISGILKAQHRHPLRLLFVPRNILTVVTTPFFLRFTSWFSGSTGRCVLCPIQGSVFVVDWREMLCWKIDGFHWMVPAVTGFRLMLVVRSRCGSIRQVFVLRRSSAMACRAGVPITTL